MADEKKAKGGPMKMMVPAVALLVVAGGGFFAMKGGSKEEKPKGPELGATASLGELLVNLDKNMFLQTTIVMQLDANGENPFGGEGGGHGGGEGMDVATVAARDAAFSVLAGRSIDELTNPDKKKELKKELAIEINHALHTLHGASEDGDEKGHGDEKVIDETWDSQSGPVLKVFFQDLAWQ